MTALERFRAIARFERKNDPFLWSIAAWDEALERWRQEGMPVDPKDRHALHELLLGRENQTEYMRPFGAISAQYRFGELRWIVHFARFMTICLCDHFLLAMERHRSHL